MHFGDGDIYVYDVDKFTLQCTLPIKITSAVDMATCERNNCLYICDYDHVNEVDWNEGLKTCKMGKRFTKEDRPNSLSISAASNVMVMSLQNIIREFWPNGFLLREICLD